VAGDRLLADFADAAARFAGRGRMLGEKLRRPSCVDLGRGTGDAKGVLDDLGP
jgi:hypothetical protein